MIAFISAEHSYSFLRYSIQMHLCPVFGNHAHHFRHHLRKVAEIARILIENWSSDYHIRKFAHWHATSQNLEGVNLFQHNRTFRDEVLTCCQSGDDIIVAI